MWFGPFVRLGWRLFSGRILLLLGLLAQVLVLWMIGELVDAFASLAEFWSELLRQNIGAGH